MESTSPTLASQPDTTIHLHEKPDNPWLTMLHSLFRNRSAVMGMIIIVTLVLVAIFADVIATHDPLLTMIDVPGEVPPFPRKAPCIPLFGCAEPLHYLGLDLNGRDLFSRIVYGSRVSLFVGMLSVTLALSVGSVLGLVSGYMGGWVDNVIMRLMDVMLAFPALLLAITIVTIFGNPDIYKALMAIAIVSIPVYARLVRASVLSVKEQEFVTAERALGASHPRIVFFHILPNSFTPIIVQAALGIGGAVLEAAALAFLGLGAQPPTPEWGQILSESRNYLFTSPHMVFFPGIAIMFTVLGFNLLGDGLRDVLDPQLRGR